MFRFATKLLLHALRFFYKLGKKSKENARENTSGFYPDWKHRGKITLNNDKIEGRLEDFLFHFEYEDFGNAGSVQKTGGDFFFTDTSGLNKLDHVVQSWNPLLGQLVAKVVLPVFDPEKENVFYFYYGNLATTDQQNPEKVWAKSLTHRHFHNNEERIKDLQFQLSVLEYLFPPNWFETHSRARHPAVERWKSTKSVIESNGNFSGMFDHTYELVTQFKTMIEAGIVTTAMDGNYQKYLSGDLKRYGDEAVVDRIRGEIIVAERYLDIMTEIEIVAWCKTKGYSIQTFQVAGADQRIDIPGVDLPIISECKTIGEDTLPNRIGQVIKKANRQIKTTGNAGYGIVFINLSQKLAMLRPLSEEIPPEIEEYIAEANRSISNVNTSVSAVVVYWTESGLLGDDSSEIKMLWSRRRSHVLLHKMPIRPVNFDLDHLKVESTATIKLRRH
jgi:hypothetical protein